MDAPPYLNDISVNICPITTPREECEFSKISGNICFFIIIIIIVIIIVIAISIIIVISLCGFQLIGSLPLLKDSYKKTLNWTWEKFPT